MYDPVYDRNSVDTDTQSAVSVLTLVLRTEDRGGAVIAALNQLKDGHYKITIQEIFLIPQSSRASTQ